MVTREVVVVVAGRAVVVVRRVVLVWRVVVVWRAVVVAPEVGVVPRRVVVVARVVAVVAGARRAVVVVELPPLGATRMVAGVPLDLVVAVVSPLVDPVVGALEPGVDCWEAPAGAGSELFEAPPAVEFVPGAAVVSAAGSVVSTDDGEPSPWTTTTGRAAGAPSLPSAMTVESTAPTVPPSELDVAA